MLHLQLEKPRLTDKIKENAGKKFASNSAVFHKNYFNSLNSPNYLYWDKAKYKKPPLKMSTTEAWSVARDLRSIFSITTPIKQENGNPFTFFSRPESEKWHYQIDTAIGGELFAPYASISHQSKQKFLMNGLIEEAIASSQLEGANTTRKAAKKLIRENRKPLNKGERMIINNFKALQCIEAEFKYKDLSESIILELHKIITDEDPDIPLREQGRYRTKKDEIYVIDERTQKIAHTPPDIPFLKKEIKRLVRFANDADTHEFIHPILKAIFLHFWVGYLHPFTDGNGRLARALFYWYLLRKNYWGIALLPISTIIKKSPAQYGRAYLYSEQDGGDLTYFYDYHIKKILLALEQFNNYIRRKRNEKKELDETLDKTDLLNERQKQLLHFLLSDINNYTTVSTHCTIYNVSRVTAHKDLNQMVKLEYIYSKKIGRQRKYFIANKPLSQYVNNR